MLRRELARKRWAREGVVIGAATDPYQPAEGRYRLTRGCIEALAAARNPLAIITRGPMIVRDIDVLVEAARRAEVSVTFSVPTLDRRDLADDRAGDGAAHASASGRCARLVDAGIDAGVGMAPILPGLSDRPELLADVVRAARDAGATSIWTNVALPPARHARALPREPRPRLAGAAAALRAAVRRPGVPAEGRGRAGPSRGGRAPRPLRRSATGAGPACDADRCAETPQLDAAGRRRTGDAQTASARIADRRRTRYPRARWPASSPARSRSPSSTAISAAR